MSFLVNLGKFLIIPVLVTMSFFIGVLLQDKANTLSAHDIEQEARKDTVMKFQLFCELREPFRIDENMYYCANVVAIQPQKQQTPPKKKNEYSI